MTFLEENHVGILRRDNLNVNSFKICLHFLDSSPVLHQKVPQITGSGIDGVQGLFDNRTRTFREYLGEGFNGLG
jgi:hypothetical protein